VKKLKVEPPSAEQVMAFLKAAKAESDRDYLIFALQFFGGCRVGQIVGNNDKRVPGMKPLEVEDIRPTGIVVDRKGPGRWFVALPDWLLQQLNKFVEGRKGRIFNIGSDEVRLLARKYARISGFQDWKGFHPHLMKHALGKYLKKLGYDMFDIRDQLQHKNVGTTNRYVGVNDPEERTDVARKVGDNLRL